MEMVYKFINCNSYDFVDKGGVRRVGVSCNVYDPDTKKILKCKAKHLINLQFGDDITVNVIPNGRFINYEVVE